MDKQTNAYSKYICLFQHTKPTYCAAASAETCRVPRMSSCSKSLQCFAIASKSASHIDLRTKEPHNDAVVHHTVSPTQILHGH